MKQKHMIFRTSWHKDLDQLGFEKPEEKNFKRELLTYCKITMN